MTWTQGSRTRWFWRATMFLWIGYCLYWLYSRGVRVLHYALIFDEPGYTDGPFQLLMPLQAIAFGLPFEYFHGKAIPFLHYPIYALGGYSVPAMEFGRAGLSLLTYVLPLIAFAWLAQSAWWRRLVIVFVGIAFAPALSFLVEPQYSLLGIRAFMPLVVGAFLLAPLPARWKALMVGVGLALALSFSTEHGLAIVGAFVLTSVGGLLFFPGRRGENGRFVVMVLAALALLTPLWFALLSGGWQGMQATFAYNFGSVIDEQVWAFGVPPKPFLADWPALLTSPVVPLLLWSVALFVCVFWRARRSIPFVFASNQDFALTVLIIYGAVTAASYVVSYASWHLLEPLLRVNLLVTTVAVLDTVTGRVENEPKEQTSTDKPSGFILSGSILFASIGIIGWLSMPLRAENIAMREYFRNTQYNAQILPAWEQYIDEVEAVVQPPPMPDDDKTTPTPFAQVSLWSTYAGLFYHRYDLVHPADAYIIHALGDERRAQYVETFQRLQPQYVETLHPNSFDLEAYLLHSRWGFYERLLTQYEIVAVTSETVLWERKANPSSLDALTECVPVAVEDNQITLPEGWVSEVERYGVVSVEVRYTVANPLGVLPVIGSLPRHLARQDDAVFTQPISLPPHQPTYAFPLIFERGTSPSITVVTESLLPFAALTVEAACIRQTNIPQETVNQYVDVLFGVHANGS